MIINSIKPFEGNHCETTATGTLLNQNNIFLSEPMLFGIGEGLGFIFWNMKSMDFPFFGGRIKPDILTQNITKHLKLKLDVVETSSNKRAWNDVKHLLDNEIVVGIKLDCYYLEYFSKPFHFAGHYIALYGYDNKNVYLIDTKQQGIKVKTSLESFAKARSAKGSMSSKNLYYTINKTSKTYDIKEIIIAAIKNNAKAYINPPIQNIGYKGIFKASNEIIKWFNLSNNIENEFIQCANLMEKAGTGGSLFRNIYRDFLKESYDILNVELLNKSYIEFIEIANLWKDVSKLFHKTGKTKNIKYLMEASEILKCISEREKEIMEELSRI